MNPRDNAKSLRKQQTDAEQRLWYRLRGHRFMDLKFKRQAPLGHYIVDFLCHEHALVVELDGGQHAEATAEYDQRRDAWLRAQGYTVLRFWNHEVMQQFDAVLEHIRLTTLSPGPSPASGRGDRGGATFPSPACAETAVLTLAGGSGALCSPRPLAGEGPGERVVAPIQAVFFDLDGTLVDTAPDLAYAVNQLRAEHRLAALDLAEIRPLASAGTRGLLKVGLGLEPGMPGFDPARQRLLDIYAANLCRETRLFAGMDAILNMLERASIPWGVITNKPDFLTRPLLAGLGLLERAAVVVSGDTLSRNKPDPMPVLYAAEKIGVAASATLLIGDDRRDMQAAHAAGGQAWAVRYGYIQPGENPADWESDLLIEDVPALHRALTAVLAG